MLDAYIIDAIRRQERAADEQGRIWLELPLESPHDSDDPSERTNDDEPERGVIVIPLHGDVEDGEEEEEAA